MEEVESAKTLKPSVSEGEYEGKPVEEHTSPWPQGFDLKK